MLIIREVFTAKPGQASKLAQLFKKVFTGSKVKVMTDLAGPYNTVVIEREVKNLAEWERQIRDYKSAKPGPNKDSKTSEEMSKYTEMYITGRREIFQILE